MMKISLGNEMSRCRKLLAGSVFAMLFAGAVMAEENPHDPYEGFNRSMFAVNEVIDKLATKPLAQIYDKAAPLPVKAGTGNFSATWVISGSVQIMPCKVNLAMLASISAVY